jgi:hypothetical protein
VAALCLHGRLPAGRSGSAAPWARRNHCEVPRPLTRTVGFRCFSGPVIILKGLLPYSIQRAGAKFAHARYSKDLSQSRGDDVGGDNPRQRDRQWQKRVE